MKLPILYLVVTEFAREGLGSGGDVQVDFDGALNQWIECRENDQPDRVLRLNVDDETCLDVTPEALAEARERWRQNNIDTPKWAEMGSD